MTDAEAEDERSTSGEAWDVSLTDLSEDPEPESIEPGRLSPENAMFVLLGVALTIGVIYRIVTLVGTTIG